VGEEYDLPEEQSQIPAWGNIDQDHTYHSGYGAQETRGPLESTAGDISGGYRDRL